MEQREKSHTNSMPKAAPSWTGLSRGEATGFAWNPTRQTGSSIQSRFAGKPRVDSRPILFWYAGCFVRFAPGDEAIGPVPELPRVYDMSSYFNMHAMLRWVGSEGAFPPGQVEQSWTARDDGGLQFEMPGSHDNGDHTRHTFEITWDNEQEKYRHEFSADCWYSEHRPMEFQNFYPRGTCHSEETGRRYTHTVWKGIDGKWNALPHNGVYTCKVVEPCRMKYPARDHGQIGFGANAEFNPMLTVLEVTADHGVVPCLALCPGFRFQMSIL